MDNETPSVDDLLSLTSKNDESSHDAETSADDNGYNDILYAMSSGDDNYDRGNQDDGYVGSLSGVDDEQPHIADNDFLSVFSNGGGSGSERDDIDDLVDSLPRDTTQSHTDENQGISSEDKSRLEKFMRMNSMDESDSTDDEELEKVIEDQFYENRLTNTFTAPPGVNMISLAAPDVDKYTIANDTKALSKVAVVVSVTIVSVVILCIIIGGWILLQKPEPVEGNLAKNNVMSHPYLSEDQQEKQGSAGDKNAISSEDVSMEMSSVTYKVTADGAINNAATSFIEQTGQESTDSFMTFPWEKTVTLSSNIVPQLGVATVGEGTVTCTVTQDGKEIASKSADGKDPTVIC